ncbi:MAG: Zn-ribbon domain-containing OB-fold protein [Acidimicrobiales bacterium]
MELLRAHHVSEYPYHRSVGAVLGGFFSGLRDGRIEGVRGDGGRVIVPPTEYDPLSAMPTGESVTVSDVGTVTTWCWVAHPLPHHLLDRPFAFALVMLDGADTALLHYVDARSMEAMSTGMRVRAVWRAERHGHICDIAAFVPEAEAGDGLVPRNTAELDEPVPPVSQIVTPIRLEYDVTAGHAQSAFLRGLVDGRFLGRRCPVCHKVYLPPRGACPTDGVPTTDLVECGQRGVVTTFCIVNVPFRGQAIELPYVCAQVLLDGADIPFMALIQECAAADVRMGMRVEAVWREPADRLPSLESLKHFRPSGEPDAPYESFKAHL